MAKYYYKGKRKYSKLFIRSMSLFMLIIGGVIFAYTFFPLISWQIYFAPAFASQNIETPIPHQNVLSALNISTVINSAVENINTDYTNAQNWYPGYDTNTKKDANYNISIPQIDIKNAIVTNKSADLTKHLVQFNSDTLPPLKGNSIIFGHSTLPQLYDPNNYKTVFANAYKLEIGDDIIVNTQNNKYNYKIESIRVVDPTDTSVLSQNFSDSFITIITCTPPGTIWKRLIIKARIQD